MISPKNEKTVQIVLSLLSMCFLLYIGSTLFKRASIDFTEEHLYTLSNGTKALLGKIQKPIKLKLYYSKTAANKGTEGLRVFNNHYLYVREFLEEMVAHSGNNLSLEVIDPRPDTAEEEDAVVYGLRKFPLSETERYFFGLVAINDSGSESIIEFFDPGQGDKLEYDLAKLIYQAQNPKKKTLGILSSLPVIKEDTNPYLSQIMRMQGRAVAGSWTTTEMAKEFFDVREIDKETKEISGVDILAVIHPKGFSEETLLAIDQYLMAGGSLMVLVDGHAVSDTEAISPYGGQLSTSPDAGLKKLIDKWGIELKVGEFVGDKYLSGVARLGQGQAPTRMLGILNCDERCSQGSPNAVTANLDRLTFVYPGRLEVKKINGVKAEPLLTTSERGNTYSAGGFDINSPKDTWQRFKEGDKPVPLAYKLTGTFQSAFPEKVEKNKKDKNAKDHLGASTKDASIMVFSDVDFLTDRFAFKSTFLGLALANNNSHLFLNAAEALSGDRNLMSIRTKGRKSRGFTRVDAIEFQAEKQTSMKVGQIQASISKFQTELNELGKKANAGNIALLQNESLRKKKELSKTIAGLKKELREVKRAGRERVENLGATLQYFNTLFVPALFILFGAWYNRRRRDWLKPSAELVGRRQESNQVARGEA